METLSGKKVIERQVLKQTQFKSFYYQTEATLTWLPVICETAVKHYFTIRDT